MAQAASSGVSSSASAGAAAAPAFASLQTREYIAHKKKVHSVAWSCGGSKLASGSVDQAIRVWTVDPTGRAVDMELRGHQDSVDQLRWDPMHSEVLGTASGDKTVRIWDARSGKCAHAIETRGENINIRWSPDGQHIAVGDKDDNISFIEMRKAKVLKSVKFANEVNEMAWEPSSRLLFLTTGAGTVDIFRYADLLATGDTTPAHTLQAHTANCYCIEFDPRGEHFAVGGADAMVSVWTVADLVCVHAFMRLEWPVRTVSFSHDGQYIAAGSEDTVIDIGDVRSGEQAHAIATKAPMNSVAWHPSRHLLAFAGDDKNRQGYDEGSLRVFGFELTSNLNRDAPAFVPR